MKEQESNSVQVVIDANLAKATVVIPGDFDQSMLSVEYLQGLLNQEGVEVNQGVVTALAELVDRARQNEDPQQNVEAVVSQAIEPITGENGYIDWTIDQHYENEDTVSYYDRSVYTMVEPDTVLGVYHDPTPGTDGRNVKGQTIKAHDGKILKYSFDETIIRKTDGTLIAQAEGVLRRYRDHASINQIIEIEEYVDFSTGNISFKGDVIVKKGIRDCFKIEATGNVEVKGLIEASTIQCGNDLITSGGFAGREIGTAMVGGSIRGRYLDQIKGIVEGDIMIDREVINCDMLVHGNVMSPHGVIVGGKMIVQGELHIGTLGSGAGVPTELILGSVPKLDQFAEELKEIIEKLNEKKQKLLYEQEMINLNTRRLTADQKERQTEIMFELMGTDNYLGKGKIVNHALDQCISDQRLVDVHIGRKLNSGVIFHIGRTLYKVSNEVKGPVRITLNAHGEPQYACEGGTESGKLSRLCELKVLAA